MKPLSNEVFQNLNNVLRKASDENILAGMQWYRNANGYALDIARKYDIKLKESAGVIAAISPGLTWELNISQTIEFIDAFCRKDELPRVGVYGTKNVDKARQVLEGKDFPLLCKSAMKTTSFYWNILNPQGQEVTIDRHAIAAAYNDTKERSIKPTEYMWLAEHYRKLALQYKVLPMQLQAICWITWKEIKGMK